MKIVCESRLLHKEAHTHTHTQICTHTQRIAAFIWWAKHWKSMTFWLEITHSCHAQLHAFTHTHTHTHTSTQRDIFSPPKLSEPDTKKICIGKLWNSKNETSCQRLISFQWISMINGRKHITGRSTFMFNVSKMLPAPRGAIFTLIINTRPEYTVHILNKFLVTNSTWNMYLHLLHTVGYYFLFLCLDSEL